jgi:hypothetical protein
MLGKEIETGLGTLPGNDWAEVVGTNGWTRAHSAAMCRMLPEGFSLWGLSDNLGITVAHEAAHYGDLPEGFDGWDWADDAGWSVAHVAAMCGKLPEGLDLWGLKNTENGMTVAESAAFCRKLPLGSAGWAVRHVYYGTVAGYAAKGGHLPEGFDRWDLVPKRLRPEGAKVKRASRKRG